MFVFFGDFINLVCAVEDALTNQRVETDLTTIFGTENLFSSNSEVTMDGD